jgi:hypothetical protein
VGLALLARMMGEAAAEGVGGSAAEGVEHRRVPR